MSETYVYRVRQRGLVIALAIACVLLGMASIVFTVIADRPLSSYLTAGVALLSTVNLVLMLRPATEIAADTVQVRGLSRSWRVISRDDIADVRLLGYFRAVHIVLTSGETVALPAVSMERLGEVRRRLGFKGLTTTTS